MILIFGMPRSGTTWLGKIFDSHPETYYLHEPDSRQPYMNVPLFPELEDEELYKAEIYRFLEPLSKINNPKVTTKRPWFPKTYSNIYRDTLFRLSAILSALAGRLFRVNYMPVYNRLPEKSLATAPVVWKSIESLGRLGLLSRLIPDAKMLHIIRHPCGQIASVIRGERRKYFDSKMASGSDLEYFRLLCNTKCAKNHGLDVHKIEKMCEIERLAWRC